MDDSQRVTPLRGAPATQAADPTTDVRFMRLALSLARRSLGTVAPNPAVGAVLTRDGAVIGRGWTQPGGRPHAETEALRQCGSAARGATLYVTLEPCVHHGVTPPCSEALIEAGVARAVVAVEDPDPRVSGRGVAALERAGVPVSLGVLEAEARHLNEGFFRVQRQSRPLVTGKLATSLDGRIATRAGRSKWITGALARRRAHLLRAEHDAIAVGVGTALADDPALTCRLPGLEDRSPIRVLFDSQLRVPPENQLVVTADAVRTLAITGAKGAEGPMAARLARSGVEVVPVATDSADRVDPVSALTALAERGITRLMLEGGGALSASFARADLLDRLAWFRAPLLLGGDGYPAVQGLELDEPGLAPRFQRASLEILGDDVLEHYIRHPD